MKNYFTDLPKNNYPLLIPGIIEKIDAVLNRLELKPIEAPAAFVLRKQGKKPRYSSICKDKKENDILFYAGLHEKLTERQRMETEIKIAEIFHKNNFSTFFPKYFQTGKENDVIWLTREVFPEGPIEKKDEIEKLGRKLSQEDIKKIAQALLDINSLPINSFSFLEKFEIEKYLELVEKMGHLEKEGILTKKDSEKAKNLILKNQKILEKENECFSHGDFQIGNIIVFKNNLRIIDFESACLNNFAFDIAFIFTRLWREPKTRKEIIKEYLKLLPKQKKEIFKTLFRIDCLFIAYHTFRSQPREYSKEMLLKKNKYYSRFMQAALDSFKKLISL